MYLLASYNKFLFIFKKIFFCATDPCSTFYRVLSSLIRVYINLHNSKHSTKFSTCIKYPLLRANHHACIYYGQILNPALHYCTFSLHCLVMFSQIRWTFNTANRFALAFFQKKKPPTKKTLLHNGISVSTLQCRQPQALFIRQRGNDGVEWFWNAK